MVKKRKPKTIAQLRAENARLKRDIARRERARRDRIERAKLKREILLKKLPGTPAQRKLLARRLAKGGRATGKGIYVAGKYGGKAALATGRAFLSEVNRRAELRERQENPKRRTVRKKTAKKTRRKK